MELHSRSDPRPGVRSHRRRPRRDRRRRTSPRRSRWRWCRRRSMPSRTSCGSRRWSLRPRMCRIVRGARRAAATPAPRRPRGRPRRAARRPGTRAPSSQRHSEILLLLATHPQGLTAEQLAVELHADDLPLVTVRAEMSRLRTALGDLAPSPGPTGCRSRSRPTPRRSARRCAPATSAPLSAPTAAPCSRTRRRPASCASAAGCTTRCARPCSAPATSHSSWSGARATAADDPEVWTAALRLLADGSPQHALARLRLAALDEEFGVPPPADAARTI